MAREDLKFLKVDTLDKMIRFNRELKVNYAVVKKGHSHFTQGYMNTKMKEFKQGK